MSRFGTSVAVVASRLVQGSASARPSIGGSEATVPVAITTARRAVSCSPPASTRRSPSSRASPRMSSIPRFLSHGSCRESSRFEITSSRRARAASTSSPPVTAAAAPGTRATSASACAGRSRAFEGMHA